MKFFHASEEARFIRRCFDLARLGAGKVSPNPMVGAVLVHQGRIIGEGYHRQYGGAHAEVEAIRSAGDAGRPLLPHCTLYVSLEPCCVFGRTPPCTNLIIEMGIPRVVIANLDQSPEVNGMGIRQLEEAGVEVHVGILAEEGQPFCEMRNTFVSKKRPYVILKYAVSADGFLGPGDRPLWMTNEVSKRLVHKWRSETDAILAGPNTLLADNPALTNRYFNGKSPLRLVLDKTGSLPRNLKVFNGVAPTWVFTENPSVYAWAPAPVRIIDTPFGDGLVPFVLKSLAEGKVTSLMVEGGQKTLNRFLEGGYWDEARVFTAPVKLGSGVPGPKIPSMPLKVIPVLGDRLEIWRNR